MFIPFFTPGPPPPPELRAAKRQRRRERAAIREQYSEGEAAMRIEAAGGESDTEGSSYFTDKWADIRSDPLSAALDGITDEIEQYTDREIRQAVVGTDGDVLSIGSGVLHAAVYSDSVHMVEALGRRPSVFRSLFVQSDNRGMTALAYAASVGSVRLVTAILSSASVCGIPFSDIATVIYGGTVSADIEGGEGEREGEREGAQQGQRQGAVSIGLPAFVAA
ncbi:hypothetical protein KIPB_011482, partial [Kipferlia bialata]|eukprot:g11482.t1